METLFQRPDRIRTPLYVIAPIFNSVRWRTRWKLYDDFAKRCDEAGAILYTVEVAFGEREFAITTAGNPRHLQLRSKHELWLKENMINLGMARLPADWKYVAWIDADITFARDDWANETVHRLQHYDVVQMFSEAADVTDEYEIKTRYQSFAKSYSLGLPWVTGNKDSYYYVSEPNKKSEFAYSWHPGFAWAATRGAIDQLGGLLECSVIGEADWYQARALALAEISGLRLGYSEGFKRYLRVWQNNAWALRGNIGVVPGTILHHWHGPKTARKYYSRTKILVDTQFDPDIDLRRDSNGLFQLTTRSNQLRDQIRQYFAQRNEDAPA